MKKPKGIFINLYHSKAIRKLTVVQKGRLLDALLVFGGNGEEPDFSDDPTLDVIFEILAESITANFEHYREVCENRSKAAQARATAKKAEEQQNTEPAKPRIRDRYKGKLVEHDINEVIGAWDSMNPEINN